MPIFAEPKKQQLVESAAPQASAGPTTRAVQAKQATAGLSYAGGAAALSPSVQKKGAAEPETDVTGPIGRVFNRILGKADGAKGTASLAFDKDQLQRYLDKNLKLADGEWFRGKKLTGVAEKLMETLDTDRNGLVTWGEFQTFKQQVLESLAPGSKPGDKAADVERAASGQFDSMEKKRDGSLNFDELQEGTKAQLPKDTDHADLIAQLGARIALDAVDTDQRSSKVKDRQLSRAEWTTAARELAQ